MSEPRERQDHSFREDISPSRTEKVHPATERLQLQERRFDLHPDSPSKYDIDFYHRKVNRLQGDLATLQEELSLARFRLTKADDFEIKYDQLFKQNQKLIAEIEILNQEKFLKNRENEQLKNQIDQRTLELNNLALQNQKERKLTDELRKHNLQTKQTILKGGEEDRINLQESYIREINNYKSQTRDKESKLGSEIENLKAKVLSKETAESSLSYKLEKIKADKNEQIDRLNELIKTLKEQAAKQSKIHNSTTIQYRTVLIQQTEDRSENLRKLTRLVEETLTEEIRDLNKTLKKKDEEIAFLLAADKSYMNENQQTQKGLRALIKKLEDQIFIIQRQNEIQLFKTIDRLKKQYEDNITTLKDNFAKIQQTHRDTEKALRDEVENLRKQNDLLGKQNKRVEGEHRRVAADKEEIVKNLSQKIIQLESEKQIDLKNYTTSMQFIEEEAKEKLQDLHSAVQNKNTQFEILNAQIKLKNEEISYLLSEINKLRAQNRQKMRNLETTNALEQNNLNDLMSSYKKEILELKRRIHELQSESSDRQAQNQVNLALAKNELLSQKQANEMLKSRNRFISNWCEELEKDLKTERVSNVNILHDTNISRREITQAREQVWVELQAIKNKEVDKMRDVFKLQKNRLESDLNKKEHQLREKNEELARLLAQYKKLQGKVGKSSKLDQRSEENGKCRATLEAEILLTENIFNAINQE